MDKRADTKATKHVRVIIVGAGPAGMGTAIHLAVKGIRPVLLLDREKQVGGIPALYRKRARAIPSFVSRAHARIVVGEEFAARIEARLAATDVEVRLNSLVTEIHSTERRITVVSPAQGKVDISADALVLACGAREKSAAERGWVTGSRPAKVFFARQLFDVMDTRNMLPLRRPIIAGSDLLSYAAAAKLGNAGAERSVLVDQHRRPECNLLSRLYFAIWARPKWRGSVREMQVKGRDTVQGIKVSEQDSLAADGVILSGDLVPNTELALLGGLNVHRRLRLLEIDQEDHLSSSGWFAAGNMLGASHGGQRCYDNGRKVAKSVLKYLEKKNAENKRTSHFVF